MDLDHLCRNTKCVNPEHLEIVTRQVNIDRGYGCKREFCKRGHPFSGENLYIRPDGKGRGCKACLKQNNMDRYEAKVAQEGKSDR